MTTLFLSYSRQDALWANAFASSLEAKGIVLWRDVDHLDPGQVLTTEISRAIDRSEGCCVLLSHKSLDSWWVQVELSAAFTRRARDPSFRLFPILLEDNCLPTILSGLLYIDGRTGSPESFAELIAMKLRPLESSCNITLDDWEPILSAIEADQFVEDPASHQYGGWSRSYSQNHLPLAFPDRVPDSVSQVDSITVTHWMIRGLISLKRLLLQNRAHSDYLDRIERRLALASRYLMKHFDGQGAGLMHMTTTGEAIGPDVRHSATFAKALLQLSHQRLEPIKQAINFSLQDLSMGDHRAPTLAERLHLIGLLRSRPDLRMSWMIDSRLDQISSTLEESLCGMALPCESEGGDARLFGRDEQWHMSGYYSWWVLDACGDILIGSSSATTQKTLSSVLTGLDGLYVDLESGTSGYPLTIHGSPDVGASAQIGEVLLRLWPAAHMRTIHRLSSYIAGEVFGKKLSDYKHAELLWAIPQFFERVESLRDETG